MGYIELLLCCMVHVPQMIPKNCIIRKKIGNEALPLIVVSLCIMSTQSVSEMHEFHDPSMSGLTLDLILLVLHHGLFLSYLRHLRLRDLVSSQLVLL